MVLRDSAKKTIKFNHGNRKNVYTCVPPYSSSKVSSSKSAENLGRVSAQYLQVEYRPNLTAKLPGKNVNKLLNNSKMLGMLL